MRPLRVLAQWAHLVAVRPPSPERRERRAGRRRSGPGLGRDADETSGAGAPTSGNYLDDADERRDAAGRSWFLPD
jgi:hypothetical protein